MKIEAHNITKNYGAFRALDNVSVDIAGGELVALLGPSGSGKTTLLRILAGLEYPDSGRVLAGDNDLTLRAPRERNMGFVFQHYALFSHMTIYENIAFGLRVRKWKKDRIDQRVHELLKLIQLEGLEKRFPTQLSGGQRQRVALARSLAAEPQMLLLDEPFGALDAKVRQELRTWLRRLHDENGITSVFVTHDQDEAFEVADRVVVMNHGRVVQIGSPDEIFAHPADDFVMDFIGGANVFHGRVENGRAHVGGFDIPFPEYSQAAPTPAKAYIRTHELEIERIAASDSTAETPAGALKARVVRVQNSGAIVKVVLQPERNNGNGAAHSANEIATPISIEIARERARVLALAVNDSVIVAPRQARVFVGAQESTVQSDSSNGNIEAAKPIAR